MVGPIIELNFPDIGVYKVGNANIDYLHRIDSGRDGPHVMITALVHGNEVCGAIALEHLMRNEVKPVRGVLSLCFVNVEAYESFDPVDPEASRYLDEDLNRVWSPDHLDNGKVSRELARARELKTYIETVDYLLDLHSMGSGSQPLVLSGPLEKGVEFAKKIGVPGVIVADAGHKAGRRLRDYGAFGDPASSKNAILIECGQHWRSGSELVAVDMVYRFLSQLKMVDSQPDPAILKPVPQTIVQVSDAITIESDEFRFTDEWSGLDVIKSSGTPIAYDGETAVTTPYDNCVLVMPTTSPKKGRTAVRLGRFVEMV